jgi:hypothetical protein
MPLNAHISHMDVILLAQLSMLKFYYKLFEYYILNSILCHTSSYFQFFPHIFAILVCLECYKEMPWSWNLNTAEIYFSYFWRLVVPTSRLWHNQYLVSAASCFIGGVFLSQLHMVQGARQLSRASLVTNTSHMGSYIMI